MPTKVIRRMLRILAHVVCRPMHLCLNMVAREQAPSAQFIQICAWLVIRQIESFLIFDGQYNRKHYFENTCQGNSKQRRWLILNSHFGNEEKHNHKHEEYMNSQEHKLAHAQGM